MDCLKNYIGLQGCKSDESESGLYINQLPGISMNMINAITNIDKVSYIKTFEDVEQRAIKRFHTSAINYFSQKYKLKNITQFVNLKKDINTIDNQTPADPQYRGFLISIDDDTNINGSSEYQVISIQSLSLYSKDVETSVDIKIFDIESGDELFSKTMALVVGWNKINVNKYFLSKKIFCCYDATDIESVYQPISSDAYGQLCDCFHVICSDCDVAINGATSDISESVTVVTSVNNTFGLTGMISSGCRFDNLICNNKLLFANAYWYLLGIEMINERLFSDRLNFWTINRESTKEILALYTARFEDEMNAACNGVDLDLSDCCVECNAQFQVIEVTP